MRIIYITLNFEDFVHFDFAYEQQWIKKSWIAECSEEIWNTRGQESKVWLVFCDVCMTELSICKTNSQAVPCAALVYTTLQKDDTSNRASVPCICYFIGFHWPYLSVIPYCIHSSTLLCTQQNELLTTLHNQCTSPPSLSLSSVSWNSSGEHCIAYIFLSFSLTRSLISLASLTPPIGSRFLLPLFSPWAQVL